MLTLRENSEIMDNLKNVMRAKGVTSLDLADRMGITRQTLHVMVKGDARLSSLQRIADALGVPVVELFRPPSTFTALIHDGERTHHFDSFDKLREWVKTVELLR